MPGSLRGTKKPCIVLTLCTFSILSLLAYIVIGKEMNPARRLPIQETIAGQISYE